MQLPVAVVGVGVGVAVALDVGVGVAVPAVTEPLVLLPESHAPISAAPPAPANQRSARRRLASAWISVEGGTLQFDLKWGKEARTNLVVESFIGQLMMMTLAEITMRGGSRRRTTWFFSYPQSFDTQLRDDFTAILRSALRGLFDDVGETHDGDIRLVTEGEAAATYFMSDYEKRGRQEPGPASAGDSGKGEHGDRNAAARASPRA